LHQLALPIQAPTPPTLDNFVCGRNNEALAALRTLASSPGAQTFMYLWGLKGSGKSHLLQGLSVALGQQTAFLPLFIDVQHDSDTLLGEETILLIDNVNLARPSLGESLFHAWNRFREKGGHMICTGDCPPAQLPLAPELTSRLAWGEVYRLHNLNDEEKWAALKLKATSNAIPISDDAITYLMMHANRDMPSLMQALDQLDTLSLSSQRTISISLVRAYLASMHSSI